MSPSTRQPADPFVFFRPNLPDRPFIVAQLGQSLDGRIATVTGDSKYIGSRPSLAHLHAIRAHVDAVVVGIGTVLADDPKLNVRLCAGPNPARVVIDAKGRLPATAQCLDGADGARRVVLRGPEAKGEALPAGVEVHVLPVNTAGRFDLPELARTLRNVGFERVLLEGGASMISQAIDAGIVDRLHLMVSPVLIGSGQPGLELRPVQLLAEAMRPKVEVIVLGEGEVLFDCDLSRRERD